MNVVPYDAEGWAQHSASAHLAVFGKDKPASWDRISYALLAVNNEGPVGYVTVRELDPESVYWQFGGVFEPFRKSTLVVRAYRALLEYQRRVLRSRRILTYIENTNLPMLRLAMEHGFQIVGTRNVRGAVMVDLAKEF